MGECRDCCFILLQGLINTSQELKGVCTTAPRHWVLWKSIRCSREGFERLRQIAHIFED